LVARTFLSVSRIGTPRREVRVDEHIAPTPTGMSVPPVGAAYSHWFLKKCGSSRPRTSFHFWRRA